MLYSIISVGKMQSLSDKINIRSIDAVTSIKCVTNHINKLGNVRPCSCEANGSRVRSITHLNFQLVVIDSIKAIYGRAAQTLLIKTELTSLRANGLSLK